MDATESEGPWSGDSGPAARASVTLTPTSTEQPVTLEKQARGVFHAEGRCSELSIELGELTELGCGSRGTAAGTQQDCQAPNQRCGCGHRSHVPGAPGELDPRY